MIHLIKLDVLCEICGKEITLECVWFDKPEEDAEYAGSVVGDNGEDKIGVKVLEAEGIPEKLVGKWIICQTHRPNGTKKGPICPMSDELPKSSHIICSLMEKMVTEGDPHPKPVENQIAHKEKSEKGPNPLKKLKKKKNNSVNT